jgi:hypothetical protein
MVKGETRCEASRLRTAASSREPTPWPRQGPSKSVCSSAVRSPQHHFQPHVRLRSMSCLVDHLSKLLELLGTTEADRSARSDMFGVGALTSARHSMCGCCAPSSAERPSRRCDGSWPVRQAGCRGGAVRVRAVWLLEPSASGLPAEVGLSNARGRVRKEVGSWGASSTCRTMGGSLTSIGLERECGKMPMSPAGHDKRHLTSRPSAYAAGQAGLMRRRSPRASRALGQTVGDSQLDSSR